MEVDAPDGTARSNYLKFGYRSLVDDLRHRFLPMAEIRKPPARSILKAFSLEFCASWRLERSGREVSGAASYPYREFVIWGCGVVGSRKDAKGRTVEKGGLAGVARCGWHAPESSMGVVSRDGDQLG